MNSFWYLLQVESLVNHLQMGQLLLRPNNQAHTMGTGHVRLGGKMEGGHAWPCKGGSLGDLERSTWTWACCVFNISIDWLVWNWNNRRSWKLPMVFALGFWSPLDALCFSWRGISISLPLSEGDLDCLSLLESSSRALPKLRKLISGDTADEALKRSSLENSR